jgi:hypothetical protein
MLALPAPKAKPETIFAELPQQLKNTSIFTTQEPEYGFENRVDTEKKQPRER